MRPVDADRCASDHDSFVGDDLAAAIHRHFAAPPSAWCLRVVDRGGTRGFGWAELGELASGFAARCAARGAVRGDVIAIGWPYGAEAIAAWAGAVLGGFVPSFVPAARLTDESWEPAPLHPPGLGHPIAIQQRTSGTTGPHRTLEISQRRVLAQVWGLSRALELASHDVIASCLPLHHDMGLVSTVLLPLVCGVPCVHVDPSLWRADAGALLRTIERSRASLTWLPPSALARLTRVARQNQVDLSSLRQIICGGEAVANETLVAFATAFSSAGLEPNVLGTGWGMAENVAAVTHSPVGRRPTTLRVRWSTLAPGTMVELADDGDDDVLSLVSVGPPIAGTFVEVRDHTGEAAPHVLGELHVRGACQSDDAWHPTGDIGLIANGEVFVCGRCDELLAVQGRWIPPHEAELAAASVAGVRPGRVAAVTDATRTLVMLVEGDDTLGTDAIAHAVERRVRRRPRVVVVAPDSLPRSTSGKLGRRRCVALLAGE